MQESLKLNIVLPYKIYTRQEGIRRVVTETSQGSFGILPNRLDCVAALVPGILLYEDESGKVNYVAVDEGILVKTGPDVLVSVRNAIGGSDLGKLRESVEKEFKNLDEKEISMRSTLARLESGFIRSFEKLRRD